MDSALVFYLILGCLLAGFIIYAVLKGLIKVVLFGSTVLAAVATYFWLAKYGFTYLSFITTNPQDWMVTVMAVLGAVTVFVLLMLILSWLSRIFSWGMRQGLGGIKGIITIVLMALVVCWVGVMCVFYYGSMAEMNRVRELALYHMDRSRAISAPTVYNIKKSITDNPKLAWLSSVSPEHEPERLALAKMIVYLVTLSPELSEYHRARLDAFMPKSRITSRTLTLKTLTQDLAVRSLVEKGDMQGLYNDVKLTRFLQDEDVKKTLSTLDVDGLLGFPTYVAPQAVLSE